jgi:dienelactone hydrolase
MTGRLWAAASLLLLLFLAGTGSAEADDPPGLVASTTAQEPAWTATHSPPGTEGFGLQWIRIVNPQGGAQLAAIARPATDEPRPVVVVLHGGHGFALQYVQLAVEMAQAGMVGVAGCWFGDHTGQPQSLPIDCPEARPNPLNFGPEAFQEVKTLVAAARGLPGVLPDRVGLLGHSAGGSAVLVYMNLLPGVQAAVTDSAGYPDGAMARSQVMAPLLILNGTLDGYDPSTSISRVRAYEAAARAAGKHVESYYYPNGEHNDLFLKPARYRDEVPRITAFLAKWLAVPPAGTTW